MTLTTKELKDLLAKVTPGEWVVDGDEITSSDLHTMDCITGVVTRSDDAILVALAPTLASEVVQLREALEDCIDALVYGADYSESNWVVAKARQVLVADSEK